MIEVTCTCGARLSLPDEWRGRKGKCPHCRTVLVIGSPTTAQDAAASAASLPGISASAAGDSAPSLPPSALPAEARAAAAPMPPAPVPPPPPEAQLPRVRQSLDPSSATGGIAPPPSSAERLPRVVPAGGRSSSSRLTVPQAPAPVPPSRRHPAAPATPQTAPSVASQLPGGGQAGATALGRWRQRLVWGAGGTFGLVCVFVVVMLLTRGGKQQPDAPPTDAIARARPLPERPESPMARESTGSPAGDAVSPGPAELPASPRQSPGAVQPVDASSNGAQGESENHVSAAAAPRSDLPQRLPAAGDSPPTPPRRAPPGSGNTLTGASREYDDPHCRIIQAQHSVRIPPGAALLEVNGERLPIADATELARSPAPYLFLPRGTHAVRFRSGELPVVVSIGKDLADVYQKMHRFFDVGGEVRSSELLGRSAKALDVHGAPFLLNFMGAADAAQGHWEAAERKFRRALRVNPCFSPAHLNLAHCLIRRKATDEAVREVELAEAFNVGNVFGLAPGIAALRRELGLAAGVAPDGPLTLVSYVSVESLSEEDQRLTALMQGLSKYATREEERAKVLNNLAAHFADTGRTELALDHFRSALEVLKGAGPERFGLARQILAHMGQACRKAGFAEAEEYERMQHLVRP